MPLSIIYGAITRLRNLLFDLNILKENKFDVHTIGVGNLSVGGAGKTPLTEYLIKLLLAENKKIATLSRGYKRKTKGFILADENSTADDIGDEPLIYKSKYPVEVAVDANRAQGILKLISLDEHRPDVILLDDAFQHRYVKSGLNILVTEYHHLYFDDYLLPYGRLRESSKGAKRADIIVVSKTPERATAVDMKGIVKDLHPLAHQQVFFSYLKYGELYSINNPENKISTLNDLFRYRVISFAGIANPEPMKDYLKEYASEVKHLPFSDHYAFQIKDLEDIERFYESLSGGNKILVATEKDLMRLKSPAVWDLASRMNIYILPVEVYFKEREEEFNSEILKYVRANKIQHQKYS